MTLALKERERIYDTSTHNLSNTLLRPVMPHTESVSPEHCVERTAVERNGNTLKICQAPKYIFVRYQRETCVVEKVVLCWPLTSEEE